MVEFKIDKNIRGTFDKIIFVENVKDVDQYLTAKEKVVFQAIKSRKSNNEITEYNQGKYTIFIFIGRNKSNLDWQKLGGKVYSKIKKCRQVKAIFSGIKSENVYDVMFGIELASYRFDKYFTSKNNDFYPQLESVYIKHKKISNLAGYKPMASLANAVRYGRDLINEPANELTPEIFAADIKRLEYLGLDVEILTEDEMKEKGFNLALAVAQGSTNRPCIAVIKWKGVKKQNDYSIGLVGKGVTFDSGGISLKPAANMWDMKQDMTGAAVVVSTMKSVALQQVKKNIVGVVGLVENMPSGSASRPGDIVRSMSGQTVEIQNTDAEGRLVLADCLTYIQQEYAPQNVIDIATLTGAIVVSLGNVYAGLFSNDDKLAQKLIGLGKQNGEELWRMPMHEKFDKMIDSTVADMKNIGGRAGGSATAACFLQRFIKKNTKWAHLDIAGMDLSDGKEILYPKGASGFGVRLLNDLIMSN